jgi:hypothetical protein
MSKTVEEALQGRGPVTHNGDAMSTPRRGFKFLSFVRLLACFAIASGCGPNPNSPSSMTGTWVGTLVSATAGNISTQLTLVQAGSAITGTFANDIPGATFSSSGNLTGTINGSAFSAALVSGTCTRTWTGTWSGTTLSGTFGSASTCGTLDSGSFSLTLE